MKAAKTAEMRLISSTTEFSQLAIVGAAAGTGCHHYRRHMEPSFQAYAPRAQRAALETRPYAVVSGATTAQRDSTYGSRLHGSSLAEHALCYDFAGMRRP